MRTYDELFAAARERSPFSNGTIGEIWMDRWCYRCTKDSPAMVDRGEGCPLILIAIQHRTPAEWTDYGVQDYRCSEFEERREGDEDPEPEPPEHPDQGTIFEEFAEREVALILDEASAVAR